MRTDLAIKFGSSEIDIFQKNVGLLARVPACIAERKNGKIAFFGAEAENIKNTQSNNYVIKYPIKDYKVVDVELAIKLFQLIFEDLRINNSILTLTTALVAVPCGLKLAELDKISSVLRGSGVDKVTFIQNGVCARYFENLWNEKQYCCVVDIGKFNTDISILNDKDFHSGATFEIGGIDMDKALQTYIQDNMFANATLFDAEKIKNETASLYNRDLSTSSFKGIKDDGEVKEMTIKAQEIRSAIINIYDKIFETIKDYISEQNISIISEIHTSGILFCGGVSSIAGFYEYAKEKFNYPIYLSNEPKKAVIMGAGKLLSFKTLPISIKI